MNLELSQLEASVEKMLGAYLKLREDHHRLLAQFAQLMQRQQRLVEQNHSTAGAIRRVVNQLREEIHD